jgi:hypothetical protein
MGCAGFLHLANLQRIKEGVASWASVLGRTVPARHVCHHHSPGMARGKLARISRSL